MKGQLLSNHVQNIKQIDRIVYLLPAPKSGRMSETSPTFYIGLYREKSVFMFNLMSKKLQRYDFPLIFSNIRLIYISINYDKF